MAEAFAQALRISNEENQDEAGWRDYFHLVWFFFFRDTVRGARETLREMLVCKNEQGRNEMHANPQSFIIKFWTEEPYGPHESTVWRSQVTHVPSGTRCYLRSSDDLSNFMAPYLKTMGIKFTGRGRGWRWLKLWTR